MSCVLPLPLLNDTCPPSLFLSRFGSLIEPFLYLSVSVCLSLSLSLSPLPCTLLT